jgi:hypothetical protein
MIASLRSELSHEKEVSMATPSAQDVRQSFYTVGGTVRRDAECYVEREADTELYKALTCGQFCYVLTPRQMGKSSLMVRTAVRLKEEGAGVVVLDLTALGENLTAEQWYCGMLSQMGAQLDLEDELLEFWEVNVKLGPLQRWMAAIRRIILPRYIGRAVVFIDEIDAVLSLPFTTDEFFSGIRELYNERAADRELERLTFCLMGVATPSELIRDTRRTPFNIGRRIELNDFTKLEARPLAKGLRGRARERAAILRRILYWTGGHPYLTQRLCQEAADDPVVGNSADIDRLCEEIYFGRRSRECDPNLLFVRERILRSEADVTALLGLYQRIWRGKRVTDEESNPLVNVLRLSGVVRLRAGCLEVRNRIYERVFDDRWVANNMPDADLRRQRAAYRRGVLRATTVSAVVIGLMALLMWFALSE